MHWFFSHGWVADLYHEQNIWILFSCWFMKPSVYGVWSCELKVLLILGESTISASILALLGHRTRKRCVIIHPYKDFTDKECDILLSYYYLIIIKDQYHNSWASENEWFTIYDNYELNILKTWTCDMNMIFKHLQNYLLLFIHFMIFDDSP